MGGKRVILLVSWLVFLCPPRLSCQDNQIYRFHDLHPLLLNPAVTGSEFLPVASLSYRKQWAGFPGSPTTMLASGTFRIGEFDFYNPQKMVNTSNLRSRERIGLGIALHSDINGPAIRRGFNLAYAYHLPLSTGSLSLGIGGSGEQRVLDGTRFRPATPDDPLIDPVRERMMLWNLHLGGYYYSAGLFGGIAAHHLIPLENPVQNEERIRPDLVLHGGYLFRSLGAPRLELSMTARYLDLEKLEYDLRVRTYIQQYHWLAVSVRSYRALALHLGWKIGSVHVAYSFMINLTQMVNYQYGSHTLHLGVNLGMRRIKGL